MAFRSAWSILLPAALLVTVSAPNPLLHLNSDPSGKGAEILVYGNPACEIDCRGAERRYFCASNGRTFDSLCRLKQAQCYDQYLNVTDGKCKNSIRCSKERSHSLKVQSLPNSTQTVNIPSCKNDGSYGQTQCNMFFGTCWCVTPLGKMVKNSTFKIGTARACERSRKGRKRCNDYADKAAFAVKLRDLIATETRRHASSSTPAKMQRDAVNRKHDKMDKNGDGSLNYKEIKKLLKPYRKKLSRSCAKSFMKFCDFDENKQVSAAEWSMCLGVRPNMRDLVPSKRETDRTRGKAKEVPTILSRRNRLPPLQPPSRGPQGTSPGTAPKSCREARAEHLKENRTNVFIHNCEFPNDEYYSQVQCYNAYCFCVVRETGVPIKGTGVPRGRPNCDLSAISADISLPISGCPSRQKEKFLRQVQDVLIKEMLQKLDKPSLRDDSNLAQSTKERAARWYFDYIDGNRDLVLGRRENKIFKKLLTSKIASKKCLKKFTQHCDRNKDSKTTKGEFIACLEVRRQERPGRKWADRRGSIDQLKTTDDPDNL